MLGSERVVDRVFIEAGEEERSLCEKERERRGRRGRSEREYDVQYRILDRKKTRQAANGKRKREKRERIVVHPVTLSLSSRERREKR